MSVKIFSCHEIAKQFVLRMQLPLVVKLIELDFVFLFVCLFVCFIHSFFPSFSFLKFFLSILQSSDQLSTCESGRFGHNDCDISYTPVHSKPHFYPC